MTSEELMFADRCEGVVEDVVGDVAALGDGLGFVELPVDAEINPALAVFFFRLGEVRERARHVGTHVAGVVFGHAVEFVGDKGERDVVGPEKSAHRLEEGAAKSAVSGRIAWKWRSEIRSGEIASRRAHRREAWIADGRCIAIAKTSWAGAEIRFADSADRSPKIVIVFRFPNRHRGVCHGGVGEGKEPRELRRAEMHLISEVNDDLIVEARRGAEARGSIVSPENSDETLLRSARTWRVDAITAQSFRFGIGGRVFGTIHCRRRWNAELTGGLQNEWNAFAPVRAERERDQADRILAPVTRLIAGEIIYAHPRFGNLRAVVIPKGKNGGSGPLA